MPDIVGPDGLEADAVVPQCLDNQYVTNEIFADMIKRGVDYKDEKIAEARELVVKTELTRSLVYSSQVVIQRAFLKNSEFLYKNYHPSNADGLPSFAALMREGAIVPFLYKEESLAEEQQFGVRDEGATALRALLSEVGDDVRCVRLAVNPADNARATDSMTTKFAAELLRLKVLGVGQRTAMATELFADPAVLVPDAARDRFDGTLDRLADYVSDRAPAYRRLGTSVTRNDVYRDFFAAGDGVEERAGNVPLGRFQAPSADDPYLLELKKLVDLIYNVNLPDHLRRYTFTPAGMPSRMALQDAPTTGFSSDQILARVADPEALEWITRSFMARTQAAMDLPLLAELSVSDVLAIRRLPEWTAFKDAQAHVLRDPLRCLDELPEFNEAFNELQRAISDWHYRTYRRVRTTRRYCNFVSFALSLGGILIVAGSPLAHMNIPHDFADALAPSVVELLPHRIKEYAAKLMIGVYDMDQHRLDANRSYTIELMQSNEELTREDVRELLNSVSAKSNDQALPSSAGLVADQGSCDG